MLEHTAVCTGIFLLILWQQNLWKAISAIGSLKDKACLINIAVVKETITATTALLCASHVKLTDSANLLISLTACKSEKILQHRILLAQIG